MEGFFVSMMLVCFLAATVCYFAAAIEARKFMMADWSLSDLVKLDSWVSEKRLPGRVRRRYFLFLCVFTLAAICIAALAVIKGDLIGILFAAVVVGGLISKLISIWRTFRGEF